MKVRKQTKRPRREKSPTRLLLARRQKQLSKAIKTLEDQVGGYVGFTCIESALMISALNRRANSIDNLVFPVPVDPSITIRGTFLSILPFFGSHLHEIFLFFALME